MYTSIRSVLARIPISSEHYDESSLLEWAYEAVGKLGVSQQRDTEVCILTVDNYKASAPAGATSILGVSVRRSTEITESDLIELCALLSEAEQEALGCNSTDPAAYNFTDRLSHYFGNIAIGGYNDYELSRIERQGIINNYNLFIGTRLYENHFEKVYYSDRAFNYHNCELCPKDIDPCEGCPYTFKINSENDLVFNFENGTVCIGYETLPYDSNGELLIPDDDNYISAIIDWVLARYWEYRMNIHDQNAFQMFQMYLSKAERTMAKARGKFQLKKLDYNSIRRISSMYSDFAKQPIVWNNERGINVNKL